MQRQPLERGVQHRRPRRPKNTRLARDSHVGGTLYFNRKDEIKEAWLRMPIGAVTVAIPFSAHTRRLLWRKAMTFE
jgi:hypothetical protein